MKLPLDIYPTLEQTSWFSTIGQESRPSIEFEVTYVATHESALQHFRSDPWADIKTEAQGDLTAYLAKYHPDCHSEWNRLAKESRAILERHVNAKLTTSLNENGFPVEMLRPVLVDLNRAVLEITYRTRFPKAPVFFERLLWLYRAGRLPCGWNGTRENWPVGTMVAY